MVDEYQSVGLKKSLLDRLELLKVRHQALILKELDKQEFFEWLVGVGERSIQE